MIPDLVQKWWDEKNYDLLAHVFRNMAAGRRSYYLRRNRNAVERVKDEFVRLFKRPHGCGAVMQGRLHEEIARYVHHLGVKTLIDDMRSAAVKYHPQSLLWFIMRSDHQASRWEMLLSVKLEEDAKAEKNAYADLWNGIRSDLRLQSVTPEWVVSAKKEWRRLEMESKRQRGTEYLQSTRSMKAIEARLENAGFSIREDDAG